MLTFDDEKQTDAARATVRIRLDQNNEHFIQFQVNLNEIPVNIDVQGKDVVVDW